ncbi:hypothetical protein [Halobellus rubicundus]|uniref:Cox cluster protein n=1 Tax=Halobellus rubicundus TaxID=2996466 RepID=A0ABD5M8T9_9EURY
MTLKDLNPIDRIVMLVSTGLMFVSVVVLGVVEILDGPPYGAAPVTNDAGEVVATPMVDPQLRTGLVVAALLILLVWAIYKVLTPTDGTATQDTATSAT